MSHHVRHQGLDHFDLPTSTSYTSGAEAIAKSASTDRKRSFRTLVLTMAAREEQQDERLMMMEDTAAGSMLSGQPYC
jgi:hypothetical protein